MEYEITCRKEEVALFDGEFFLIRMSGTKSENAQCIEGQDGRKDWRSAQQISIDIKV
jgi:hypothetical protein